jgi:hypothetical protein
LRSVATFDRHAVPRPTASGYALASRLLSTNSALMFSRWAFA